MHVPNRFPRFFRWLLAATLLGVLVPPVFNFAAKRFDPYKLAIQTADKNRDFIDVLGSPTKEGWFFDGKEELGSPSTAQLLIPVEGSVRTGNLRVRAIKENGRWRLTQLTLEVDKPTEKRVDLLWNPVTGDYSKRSVDQLIDDLTLIDSQSPGINSAAVYEGFIADNSPGSFEMGVLGSPAPKVPPQMSELVRRGPLALPELIRHLDDTRPTKFEVGNTSSGNQIGVNAFMFMNFSDEYDPRVPHWWDDEQRKHGPRPMERDFTGTYRVKVADVCYVLIGQIVNRQLLAVRYQPTGGLIVNSPIEAPSLAERVRKDWGNTDAENLRQALLEDVRATNQPKRISRSDYTWRFVKPALARLRFYFPDTYRTLQGDDLTKRKEFEEQETKERLAQSQ